MPLSPEAKLVLQHASEEAERMDASHIDTEHLLLGLLRESECLAADILTSKGLHPEEVREETRLQSPAKEVAPRPKEAFPKLADFPATTRRPPRGVPRPSAFHQEAIRVEVALPEEK